ncbi:MAG: hypothetical protein AAF802_14115 [Planctomycetota bacterium]
MGREPSHRSQMSLSQKDFYKQAFSKLRRLECPIFLLPGEHDVPLADFARLIMMAEVDNANLHCVHATPYESDGDHVVGVGGDLNEVIDTWNDRLRSSRAAAEYYLRHLNRTPIRHSIVMLTTPTSGSLSRGTHSDIAGDEKLASELVHSSHPELAIVFGETKCRGVSKVAGTTIVNPGRLSDGSSTLLSLSSLDSPQFLGVHREVASV